MGGGWVKAKKVKVSDMPKDSLNIYFAIRDGASPTLSVIADKTRALDKETQELEQSYQALQKANAGLIQRQTQLKKELSQARDEAKDAKKAFEELGDAANQDAYEKAQENVERLRNEISATSKALRENEQIFKNNMETVRKGSAGSETSILSALGQAGVWSTLGDVGGELATTLVSSALGSSAGNVFSSALGMAGAGAAAGSMILPGIGTAIGAAGGALVGAVQGLTQTYEEQDDAFKEYYGGLFDTVNEQTESMISSGSTIAGSREQTQVAFAQRLGSDAAAEEYLGRVQEMAARTNYDYDEITGYSKLLLNSYDPEEVFGVLQSLSDATAGLNLSGADVEQMIAGLSRMRTTDKTTQEYLNYFSERGVDVYTALADALEVDKGEIAGMVSKGQVGGVEAAEIILDYIDQEFGGLSERLSGTYDAMVDNLEDIKSSINAAGGEGYNEERKEGIQAEMDALEGPLGTALEAINAISGQNQAYLENLSEQYQREALSAVLLGQDTTLFDEDQQATLREMGQEFSDASDAYEAGSQEAGLKMEALKEEAEALATAAYESSEQYQTLQGIQMDQIGAIRENTAALNSWRSAYNLQQERSKGLASVDRSGRVSAEDIAEAKEMARNIPGMYGFAYGLDRVPYDGYPALLHEGERVLTASQARAQDAGVSGGVQVSIGSVTIGGGLSTWDIAMEIAKELERAAVAAAPR